MGKVCKRQLAQLVSERAAMPRVTVRDLLAHVFEVITEELAKGNSVGVPGFGTWRMKVHTPRTGRDPRSGRRIAIPPRTRVAFKAGARLRRRVESSIEPEIFFGEGVGRSTALDHAFAKLFGSDLRGLVGTELRRRLDEALATGTEREAAEFFACLREAGAADAAAPPDQPPSDAPAPTEPASDAPQRAEGVDDETGQDDAPEPVAPERTPGGSADRGR